MKAAKDAALLIAMTNEGTSKQPWHKEREREREFTLSLVLCIHIWVHVDTAC